MSDKDQIDVFELVIAGIFLCFLIALGILFGGGAIILAIKGVIRLWKTP